MIQISIQLEEFFFVMSSIKKKVIKKEEINFFFPILESTGILRNTLTLVFKNISFFFLNFLTKQ